ncbi:MULTISPECIES: hypothetical protein [unclassified Streptomyces]
MGADADTATFAGDATHLGATASLCPGSDQGKSRPAGLLDG